MKEIRKRSLPELLQLQRQQQQFQKACTAPEEFRKQIWLPGEPPRRLINELQPWQLNDFQSLDSAWKILSGQSEEFSQQVTRRAYFERPRGHSKTSDMAVQVTWILLAARQQVNGLAAAADKGQAYFLYDSVQRFADANPKLCENLQFVEDIIRNRLTGSRLEIISSDVKSSYGALPDFVVCDELSHWQKPELWYSLLSSAAKKPECVLVVLTNAGVGRGWQWEVREHARQDRHWHFSSLVGPQAPWISDDWLLEQRALLPEQVFERLWLNVWQHAEGNFLSLSEVESCRSSERSYQLAGENGRSYVAAIDYAEKHDLTVGCVCHREGELFVVDRMDVVKPTPAQPTRIAWVEDWIEDVASRFPNVRFIVDEYQLVGTVQRLEGRYPIERFAFRGGEGNHRLATLLRQLIVHQRLAWYPDCGTVPGQHRDDLETELASLILKQSNSGRIRIDHHADGKHHDDRSFALGVACLGLNESEKATDFLLMTLPDPEEDFAW